MRKGSLRIPQSFRGSKGAKVNLWKEVGGVGNWRGGGRVPFLHRTAGLPSAPEAAFLAVRKIEVCKITSSLEWGDKYLRLHAKEWTDRWTKGRGSAEGQNQAQVPPSPEEGQVHRAPASLQVQDSPALALLPRPPPGSAPRVQESPLEQGDVPWNLPSEFLTVLCKIHHVVHLIFLWHCGVSQNAGQNCSTFCLIYCVA